MRLDYPRCSFQWEAEYEEMLVHCSCIRRPNHEGNHVSYPSGEECRATPKKKPKEKQLT